MSSKSVNYHDRSPPPSNRQLLIIFGIFAGFTIGIIWLISWMPAA